MNRQLTHLVINYIFIDQQDITVGATDNERWRWEIEDGASGANAKTIVFVTLTNHGKGNAISEKAEFHCGPGAPTRPLALSALSELFNIEWSIKNKNIVVYDARELFYGKKVKDFE